ncbi:uncharacterized protein LOC114272416 [Camellia sinensis]|uniref:RING-type domain-containing protein n=1 Tax=Camellia sinensis var. sinensis TaxID=542762 RepID=A0A4S4EFC1_CAMSN|nr:uncharacterized protein LOC114272416 [Camellia sinensis]THG14486.1 hypothetical protein TEA_007800 [Camellia sinensis var. sinensis]
MGPDSILNASLPALSKDLGKKKRTNRLAKLKQSKLDVRREQCLSQGAVKNEACKADSNDRGRSPPASLQMAYEGNRSKENIKLRSREVDAEGSSFHESDMDSLMSSSVSSSLGQHDSMKDLPGTSCSSASSMCFSRSVSEADEDDGCLDDWEAVADALSADENQNLDLQAGLKTKIVLADHELPKKNCGVNVIKIESKVMVPRSHSNDLNCRAWCPDDALRPRGLPNLSKKHTLTMNSEWLCGHGTIARGWQSVLSQPSPCPICYEDLDVTDSSFLPCSCGFRLCLFCHKRILEADGRCPGCRKHYEQMAADVGFNGGVTSFCTGQPFSMSTKS